MFLLPSPGYAEAQLRQYQRLTKQIKPDMESYERQREEWCVKARDNAERSGECFSACDTPVT